MSTLRTEFILAAPDLPAAIATLSRFEATMTLAELRRHDRTAPGHEVTLRSLAVDVLQRWPHHGHARAAALAALVDVGELNQPSTDIAARLQAGDFGVADLRVAARLLRIRGARNSANWVHRLADDLAEEGRPLTPETIATIVERLHDRWLIDGDFIDDTPETDAQVELVLRELEAPLEVPGLPGLRVRQIRSRQKLDRFSSHLQNCASTYLPLVRSGATKLLGLEQDGVPVELLEVHPRDGRIRQWKGKSNAAADPQRRRIVEPFLVEQGLVAP